MRRRRYSQLVVGEYTTRSWPYKLNQQTRNYENNPPKPRYRSELVTKKTGTKPNDEWPGSTYHVDTYDILDDAEIINTEFTIKNSHPGVRAEQAAVLAHFGYFGPISGGEARALKTLFNELGYADLVKHGWVLNNVQVIRQPTKRNMRRHQLWGTPLSAPYKVGTIRLQQCYVFKSPIAEIPFDKFVKLARMYKDDDGRLRTAVIAVLANPAAHKEIETLDALEILGGMETAL